MKYPYEFKVVKIDETSKVLSIKLPKEIELIETFLFADIQSGIGSKDWVLEAIDKVLSGKSKIEKLSGNICCLIIEKDITEVRDNYVEYTDVKPCTIETIELRELINIWCSEYERFEKLK